MKKTFTTWKNHEGLVEHYTALGQSEVWLSDYDGPKDRPWEYVTRCEPGGSHRLEISTDITFYATAPSGLTYRWSFDIEPRSANGKGNYEIATGEIKRVAKLLPKKALESFNQYLSACAIAVRKKADEWNAMVTAQYGMACELEKLAGESLAVGVK